MLSLEYKETKEALNFFNGVRELSEIKFKVLNGELNQYSQPPADSVVNSQAAEVVGQEGVKLVNGEEREKAKKVIEKKLWNLEVINQYCDYIINKDQEGFTVKLKIDE